MITRRSPRRMPPWIASTASGRPAGSRSCLEVVEGVAVLGEDDQLARPTVGIGSDSVVLQDRRQFGPFAIRARVADLLRRPTRSASSRSSALSSSTVCAAVAASISSSSSCSSLLGVEVVSLKTRQVEAGLGVPVGAVWISCFLRSSRSIRRTRLGSIASGLTRRAGVAGR